jgi:hypothetical protein
MDSSTDKKLCKHCGHALEKRTDNQRRFGKQTSHILLICLNCDKDYYEKRPMHPKSVKAGVNESGFNFVENLEIFPEEISKATWHQVFEINSNLKDNWRVTKLADLKLIYESRIINNFFKATYYWSMDDDGNHQHAWAMSMNNGFQPLIDKNKQFSALIIREMYDGNKENR